MELAKTNTHNFSVQLLGAFTIIAVAAMNAYPLPALAFAQVLSPRPAYFPQENFFAVTATAYSSTPEQTDSSPFITASGSHVRHGIIAANFLPLGTKIRLGKEIYTVEDRMSKRYNGEYRIDIWMASLDAAQNFGSRTLLIEVITAPSER
ncbi:MAG: hypothetical protein A3C02_02760 [Candidatus Andersenbacteria bacterium RIFCSPHIGHO2_02_FULL_45_11]|uniref:3D domain-containing protein n=1 Tax=Candidatus Andersenbacteria bacterium RIFCSPHIGHO2_12_FULL_45_11 TaxID=1797281 RepID=A0A1G1X6S5_9BACT|nr:MAG: hypothetical protein A2805_03070 [Candidatus Andersenbacteria bacterium RIFCSPHIGHO2_01_FULL_46_36]OGY33620.1 MAG: hypothetical protein A3C02_02760 [Candidatus Andersenbacteria bacterium RIFCSPHIGHO2_02_FULL_45_11]OGY35290.1 MAG: hypothetical protein A3D99_04310 [Candidatus Andersenbacteria bacterium RIFCSPHIGHO2_12_FULL_45_11]